MRKKSLLYILTSILLVGCSGNKEPSVIPTSEPTEEPSLEQTQEPSVYQTIEPTVLPTIQPSVVPTIEPTIDSTVEPTPEKEIYTTINSSNDLVYIYGLVGEKFDLSSIDCSRVFDGKITYKVDEETNDIEINENEIIFNKKGVYNVTAYNKKNILYKLLISVNEDENNRYLLPNNIDLSDFVIQSGNSNNISVIDSTLKMSCTNSDVWHRITYSLPDEYSKNYSIECDVSFKNTKEKTRWFGIVFRDQETSNQKYPYYQFDIRQNTSASNAIEITNVYGDGQYSYPYISSWDNGGFGNLTSNDIVHMKLDIHDRLVSCELSTGSYTSSFNAYLPSVSSGGFGFQCSGADVEISNIEINMDKNTIVSSTADPKDSIVNIYDDVIDGLKPHIIGSGLSTDEIYGVGMDVQQYYVKAIDNQLFNLNDELMDLNLNDLLLETKKTYIPNIHIEDLKTLNLINEICSSYAISDFVIWSSNDEILVEARKLMPYARLGYIPTSLNSFETFEEIGSVCRKAGALYANQIMIDYKLLNKENVCKAVGLGYSIVANAKNGENYSVIDSALAGCKLILANFTESVQQQVEMIYDPTIFNVDEKPSLVVNQTHSLLSVPYATGHRGSGNTGGNVSCDYPENTIESFIYAYQSGAYAVEIDIHLTKDNRLAIIHNGSTDDYTDALHKYTVATTNLEDLQKIPLKTPSGKITYDYHIPSYEELLEALNSDFYKDKTMVVELKDGKFETGKLAIDIAKKYGWYNRITFITFSASLATMMREYDPAVQVSYLNTVYRTNNEEYWSSVNSFLSSGVGLASQISTVSKEALQESNARGQIYWLWTFNKGDYSSLITQILDGNMAFTTNYVQFFSNNKYKLTFDETITLQNGESKQLSATSVTYNKTTLEETDVEIIVLSDNAKSDGNTITRTGEGTIYAIIKHKTKWDFGSSSTNFYIYSDIIEIN